MVSKIGLALAGGLSAVVLGGILASTSAPEGAGQVSAARPRLVNARVEPRPAGPDLAKTVSGLIADQASPAWIGYSVAMVPGRQQTCEAEQYPGRVYLEGRPDWTARESAPSGSEEGPGEIAILLRVAAGTVQKVRAHASDCELDAGGLRVIWLESASAPQSVEMLLKMVAERESDATDRLGGSLTMAIALHRDAAAQRALEALVAPGHPQATRKHAAFWLGAARGDRGFETLRRLLSTETDSAFRRELVFPVSLGRLPESVELLIHVAREDRSAEVRKQAMFWLGQKAGARVVATLAGAVDTDPDTDVKKRAVFSLSRLPGGEGVPHLIEAARNNANPAVRRQAMFWLGQSNDPRALSFLEEFLRK